HATEVLAGHGLVPGMAKVAVETAEAAFFNRFGQLIYREPLGKRAGYSFPQFSIHRGDLQKILLDAVRAKLGADRLHLGWHLTSFDQDERQVTLSFKNRERKTGSVLVACDGIHSVVRQQLYPKEGEPRYSGVNMWRGVTRWKPILGGATMVRAGWLSHGKMVIYPIRDDIDGAGTQLVNWVAEIETSKYRQRDWTRPGELGDFIGA